MTSEHSRAPKRPCRTCGALFADALPGQRSAPAGYCSADCHSASRPAPATPARTTAPRASKSRAKPRAVSPASPEQRAAVRERACVVCRGHAGRCHPAHLIDRSLTTVGQDDPRAVIPLCPTHHRLYDDPIGTGGIDLLPYLEPHFRVELAYAVERVGLLSTLRRVTNDRRVDERRGASSSGTS